MSGKVPISVIILTYNEETNIANCLESLTGKSIYEVKVVDSGSKDRTLDVAKDCGAEIYVHAQKPFNSPKQRNWGLRNTNVRGQWVVFIDADERVTVNFIEELQRKISEAPESVAGFRLCQKHMFLGRWMRYTMMYPNWHDRVVLAGYLYYDENSLDNFDVKAGDVILNIEEPVIHHALNSGFSHWIIRQNHPSTWEANAIFRLKRKSVNWTGLFSKDQRRRRTAIKHLMSRMLWISPFSRFCYHYFLKGGMLEGKPGLILSMMWALYQFLIYLKVIELERRERGLEI